MRSERHRTPVRRSKSYTHRVPSITRCGSIETGCLRVRTRRGSRRSGRRQLRSRPKRVRNARNRDLGARIRRRRARAMVRLASAARPQRAGGKRPTRRGRPGYGAGGESATIERRGARMREGRFRPSTIDNGGETTVSTGPTRAIHGRRPSVRSGRQRYDDRFHRKGSVVPVEAVRLA